VRACVRVRECARASDNNSGRAWARVCMRKGKSVKVCWRRESVCMCVCVSVPVCDEGEEENMFL